MIGFPKTFNSKQDYLNIITSIEEAKTAMVDKLQSLLDTRQHWVGQGPVDGDYSSASDEKVMPQEEGEGENKVTTYQLFKLEEDPSSAFNRFGFTEEEVNQLISDLEV